MCLTLVITAGSITAIAAPEQASAAEVETVTDCSTDAGFDQALEDVDDGGTVNFDCGEATVPISTTKTIEKAVTIDGGGIITLSGGENTQLFVVSSSEDLTVRGLTLADGRVPNSGDERSNFRGSAVYVDSGGSLEILDSAVRNNVAIGSDDNFGGAIYSFGTATINIERSTFSDNEADRSGGAIYSSGPVTISDSTFTRNRNLTSSSAGGAIFAESSLEIVNSTFVENESTNDAGGAIRVSIAPTAEIESSTFSNNTAREDGGAISLFDSSMTLTATVFEGNSPNSCLTESDSSIQSGGYNLADDESCGFNEQGDNQDGDARLGELADNGGPTPTMLPGMDGDAFDSIPATDGVCDAGADVDQRAVARPQFGACDIGAVEVQLEDIPEATLCANRYNGDLRMPRTDACASTELSITLPEDGQIDVCVSRYNGDVRYSRTGSCASTETAIQVSGFGDQSVCVNRYNGDLRVPRMAGQCASTEIARMI